MLSTDIILAAAEGSRLLNPMLKIIQGRRSACRDRDFIVALNSTQNLRRRPLERRGSARAHSRSRHSLSCPRASAPPRCKPSASPQQPPGAHGQPWSSSHPRSHPLALHKAASTAPMGAGPRGNGGTSGLGAVEPAFQAPALELGWLRAPRSILGLCLVAPSIPVPPGLGDSHPPRRASVSPPPAA